MVHHPPPLPQWLHYKIKAHGLPLSQLLHQPVRRRATVTRGRTRLALWYREPGCGRAPPPGKKQTDHPKLRFPHSGLLSSTPMASSSPFLSRDIAGGDGGIFCLDQLIFPLPCLG